MNNSLSVSAVTLTIAIKALNESAHIADVIRHALEAARPFGGEVVLADSCSEDDTVAIARQFPVRIVQLARKEERCCGAGAQLAFQHARGDYFYLLDGDMMLSPDFLPAAIAYLESHPQAAGVGGQLRERVIANQEFAMRAEAAARLRPEGDDVPTIDGGGLYRRAAIEAVGYFSDRNLHAFEETDLALRLRSQGWRLARIPVHAVDHFGHAASGYGLLWRRIRSGYAGGAGEVLRAALGTPRLGAVVRKFSHLRNAAIVLAWWLGLVLLLGAGLWPWALVLFVAPLVPLLVRRRDLGMAFYTFVQWNGIALATILGVLRSRQPPERPLESVVLAEPAPASVTA